MKNPMKGITVKNMTSSKGNDIANQFIINVPGKGVIFQSYSSTIAYLEYGSGRSYLDKTYWDYSVTTGKYRNQFLGETKKETERKIASGEYILADLN